MLYTMHSLIILPFLFSFARAQLHTQAQKVGFTYFGTATDNPELTDTAYVNVLSNISEFGQITPGNSMKWDAIEPQPGNFTFAAGDVIANLAAKNKQLIRCHNLVWHQQLPEWVTNPSTPWTAATLTTALQFHVTSEVSHYKGKCYAWDVVNEALNDNGTFRNDIFFSTLGQDYIRIAFEAAAAADPDVKLYYNDFGTETAGVKSSAALNIVKTLKAAGTKIDGVGFQSHFIVGETPSTQAQMSNLNSFTALGVEVAITELDIRMPIPATTAMLSQQKTDYQTTTSACLMVEKCVGITVWDFDDKYSWVPSTFNGTGAACLFDQSLTRKPAYSGALGALTAAGIDRTRTGTNSSQPNMTMPSMTRTPTPTVVSDASGLGVMSALIWPLVMVAVVGLCL